MPPSRPQTPLDQRPAHLRALLPPGLAEQDVALRLARLKRQLDGATGGGAGGLTRGWEDATDGFAAFVQKQRIVSSDPALADALALQWSALARKRASEQRGKARDRETDITAEKYAEHLTFLLALARPATSETHALAHSVLAQAAEPAPTERDVWASIFGEPSPSSSAGPRSAAAADDGWQEPDWGSNASDISWDDNLSLHGELLPPSSPPSSPAPSDPARRTLPRLAPDLPPVAAELPEPWVRAAPVLPDWATEQYYADVHGWDGVSSAPSLGALLAVGEAQKQGAQGEAEDCWMEAELVGEVLCALGGRETAAFQRDEHGVYSVAQPISLLHLPHPAVRSLLEPLNRTASDLARVAHFSTRTLAASLSTTGASNPSLVEQAFASAVEDLLVGFRAYLGALEAALSRGDDSPSLLSLGPRLEPRVRVLTVLGQLVDELSEGDGRGRAILDALDGLANVLRQEGALETAAEIEAVFVSSAEPLWALVGRFLRDGISLAGPSVDAPDADFFVQPSASAGSSAGADWAQMYTLVLHRLPQLFEALAPGILGAGKAVGLLRALGVEWEWTDGRRAWPSLASLLAPSPAAATTVVPFTQMLETYLLPLLADPQKELHATLQNRCALRETLDGVESLFYLSNGVMGDWTEELFLRMDNGKPWADPYTLKASLRDAAEAVPPAQRRIDVDALGIAVGRKHLGKRSVRALALSLEYSVSFPLGFIFHPPSLHARSRVFTLLLQVARARHVLSRLSVSQSLDNLDDGQRKAFIGARLKLVWIVNVLWRYLAMDVMHVQTQRLHALMGEAETLDDLIGLQDEHVSAVQDLCLLSSQTTPLHRTVLAILDLALLLADLLASFLPSVLGDSARSAAAPPSTRPPLPKRTKSKRSYRSRMKYGVGSDEEDISDLEPVGGDDGDVGEGGEGDSTWAAGEGSRSAWAGQTTTIDFVSEDLAARLQRLTADLRKHVRGLRRGIDTLAKAAATTPATEGLRATRETLSFALEEWKE